MAMTVGGGGKSTAPEINVTPLVDVVLVLLIIFMVVTPLLTKKFWLHVPKQDERSENRPAPNDQEPLVLSYRKDGVIKVNAQVIPRVDLQLRLSRMLAARPDNVVFFDADGDADYGEAVQVMDLARGSGAVTIAVLTEATSP
jgi:biopolymer transport protein ExbD